MTPEPTPQEITALRDAAGRAALTVIARTSPSEPARAGEYFSGLHAAHAAFRTLYVRYPHDTQHDDTQRQVEFRLWATAPTPEGSRDYRDGHADFTDRILRILDRDAYTIALVLDHDLTDLPLECLAAS